MKAQSIDIISFMTKVNKIPCMQILNQNCIICDAQGMKITIHDTIVSFYGILTCKAHKCTAIDLMKNNYCIRHYKCDSYSFMKDREKLVRQIEPEEKSKFKLVNECPECELLSVLERQNVLLKQISPMKIVTNVTKRKNSIDNL